MQPLVLTLATDGFDASWRFCLDSQQLYCERLGYIHRLVTERVGDLNGKWSKLQLALDALLVGHDVLVIDADAEITAAAPGFADLLRESDGDIIMVLGVSGRPNSGVMMLSGGVGSVAADFVATCIAERDTPVPPEDFVTTEGENGHVINILKREPYASRFRVVDRRWNCTVPEEAENAFVRHYTNKLRSAMYAGPALKPLVARFPLDADEAAARKRADYGRHQGQRKQLVQHLAGAAERLDEVRARVTKLQRLEYPRLVDDNANAWVWRFEFARGLLELPTVEFLRRLVAPDMWIVDGGAHVGYFTDMFLNAGATPDRLLAVEAHPANVETLRRNVEARGARILPVALGDVEGSVRFNDGAGHSNSSVLNGGPASGVTFEVPMRTLDAIAAEVGMDRLGLMKIDVEGAEPMALKGARSLLDRSPDAVLVVESNPHMLHLAGSSPDGLVRQLGEMGFIARTIFDNFMVGPAGVALPQRTFNIAFARPGRWEQLLA